MVHRRALALPCGRRGGDARARRASSARLGRHRIQEDRTKDLWRRDRQRRRAFVEVKGGLRVGRLNLVVVTLRVPAPWGGCPIALPAGMRLAKKGGPTIVELAETICRQLAEWLADREFELACDGAYASLIGRGLPRTTVTSRMQRDAAICEAAPPQTGKRGRPRTKGDRLPAPCELATSLCDSEFDRVELDCRGRVTDALVWTRQVLWYGVERRRMVTLVVVRDRERGDHFFVSDDEAATGGEILARYVGRWSIEVCFRDVKQCLGAEDPQSWKGDGPERAAALSLWLHSAIWAWYVTTFGSARTWTVRPWFTKKRMPSGLDALAALRRALWSE